MKLDISNMPDNELVSLRDKLTEEIEIRENRQKEKMWLAVREAIAAYIEHFGSINVENDYYIDSDSDLTTPGEIFQHDW